MLCNLYLPLKLLCSLQTQAVTGVGGGEFSVAVTVHLTANSVVSLPSDLSASGGVNQQETAVIGLSVGVVVLFLRARAT